MLRNCMNTEFSGLRRLLNATVQEELVTTLQTNYPSGWQPLILGICFHNLYHKL